MPSQLCSLGGIYGELPWNLYVLSEPRKFLIIARKLLKKTNTEWKYTDNRTALYCTQWKNEEMYEEREEEEEWEEGREGGREGGSKGKKKE